MHTPEVWDANQGSQRKELRYLTRWKVALVFDDATTHPIFQTFSDDLSITGISVQYQTDEKLHTVLTVLLAPPPINNAPQKVIKLKAEIVSSVPYRGSYRIGMNFIQDAELDKLRKCIEMLVTADNTLPSHPEGGGFPTLNF